jgi:prevent-host-death family protein
VVTSSELRARLGTELDGLRETEDALYVSRRGRPAVVVLDAKHYAALVERLEFLEDSLAALTAREHRESAVLWSEASTRSRTIRGR